MKFDRNSHYSAGGEHVKPAIKPSQMTNSWSKLHRVSRVLKNGLTLEDFKPDFKASKMIGGCVVMRPHTWWWWALFVTYTIIQSIMRSEMCSLHLTHPSVHTWSSGQPTVQRPGSSRGLPVGAGIRTHNLGLPRVSSPTLYPLGQRLPLEDCRNDFTVTCDLIWSLSAWII